MAAAAASAAARPAEVALAAGTDWRLPALRPGLVMAAALVFQTPSQLARVAWLPNPRRASPPTWISDAAHHLRPATLDTINQLISDLERETTAEIALVIADSTAGLEPQEFATTLHRVWGIGKAVKNNGALLLWDPVHRVVFISVGTGLEGALPGPRAGRIRDDIVAALRENRFDSGVLTGARAIAAAIREEYGATAAPVAGSGAAAEPSRARAVTSSDDRGGSGAILGILGGLVAVTGGAFGWMAWQRRRPRRCTNGHRMHRLSETSAWEDWVCDVCGQTLRLPGKALLSHYQVCPACKHRTALEYKRSLVGATTDQSGLEEVTLLCQTCAWKNVSERMTPIIPESPTGHG